MAQPNLPDVVVIKQKMGIVICECHAAKHARGVDHDCIVTIQNQLSHVKTQDSITFLRVSREEALVTWADKSEPTMGIFGFENFSDVREFRQRSFDCRFVGDLAVIPHSEDHNVGLESFRSTDYFSPLFGFKVPR